MLHVIATVQLLPGARTEFIKHFKDLVPTVLAEAGCVAYEPTIDLDTGLDGTNPPRENTVVVVEQWESLDHLKAHLAAPHMATFRETVGSLVESVSLSILESA